MAVNIDIDAELWRFALEYYGGDGVSRACLVLQERTQTDIVHLLGIIFCDRVLDTPLSGGQIVDLRDEMASWRRIAVLPLRSIRQAMKQDSGGFPPDREAFRQQVQRLELQAERMQFSIAARWLAARVPEPGLEIETALVRLLDISSSTDWRSDGDAASALNTIVAAARSFSFQQ